MAFALHIVRVLGWALLLFYFSILPLPIIFHIHAANLFAQAHRTVVILAFSPLSRHHVLRNKHSLEGFVICTCIHMGYVL